MGRGPAWTEQEWMESQSRLQSQTCPEIARQTGWSLSSVKKAAARARQGVGAESRNHYRGKKKLFPEQEEQILELAKNEPVLTSRELLQRTGADCSLPTVRRITARAFTAYKKTRVQALTTEQKQAHMRWATWMARRILAGRGVRTRTKVKPIRVSQIVFSDEKLFRCRAPVNFQNSRVRVPKALSKHEALKSDDFKTRLKAERSQSNPGIMVGCLWSSALGLMPPVLIEPGVIINSDVYIRMVQDKYMPWILPKPAPEVTVFQEDGAPSHSAKATAQYFQTAHDSMERLAWPSCSPDLNPLDFNIWSVMQSHMPKVIKDRASLLIAVHAASGQRQARGGVRAEGLRVPPLERGPLRA